MAIEIKVKNEQTQQFEITMMEELSKVFADCDEVLSFNKSVEDDYIVVVSSKLVVAIQGISVILEG